MLHCWIPKPAETLNGAASFWNAACLNAFASSFISGYALSTVLASLEK